MSGAGPQARIPLVGMLLVSVCAIIFTALVNASVLASSTLDATGSTGQNVTVTGSSSQCSHVLTCFGKVISFVWDTFTFNVAGAPDFIRFFFVAFYGATTLLGILVIFGVFTL